MKAPLRDEGLADGPSIRLSAEIGVWYTGKGTSPFFHIFIVPDNHCDEPRAVSVSAGEAGVHQAAKLDRRNGCSWKTPGQGRF